MSDPDGTHRWARPEWLAEARAWIRERLAEEGIEQAGAIEQPHLRWWSTVLRVPTGDGDLYFKALAPAFVFEAALTGALARWAPDRVTELLAVDAGRGWMLMRGGGTRLREVLVSPADLGRWEEVLPLGPRVRGCRRRCRCRSVRARALPRRRPDRKLASRLRSAVAASRTPGVFVTAIPRRAVAARSMRS